MSNKSRNKNSKATNKGNGTRNGNRSNSFINKSKQVRDAGNKAGKYAKSNRIGLEDDSAVSSGAKFPVSKVSNDPGWYFKDKNILDSVASFSFNNALGRRIPLSTFFNKNGKLVVKAAKSASTASGVMGINIGLTAGVADSAQDPLNLAAVNVYSYVRYKNSGAANYDAPDFMLYLVAMDSIYACWNWLKRVYGIASTYSQLNRYEPKGMFAIENIDFDDIISNLANFRSWLNVKADEISAYCVPATMTYNVRHSWLFSNVFADSESGKAQLYMYVPDFFFKYDETSSPNGGKLTPIACPRSAAYTGTTPAKLSDLKNILNTMLEALNYSEDIGVMSGDVLKAYESSGLFKLSTFEADYRVEPTYSKEVLTQIENLTITTFAAEDIPSFAISQDPNTNFLKCKPVSTYPGNFESEAKMLNFHWNNPTPEDVVVATRLTSVLGPNTSTTGVSKRVISCGSEVTTGVNICTWAESADVDAAETGTGILSLITTKVAYAMPYVGVDNMLATDVHGLAEYLDMIAKLSQFDWAPYIPIGYQKTKGTNGIIYGLLWDYDVYTHVNPDNLSAINQMALLTEFNVPN